MMTALETSPQSSESRAPISARYKSYSLSHFSRFRTAVHMVVLSCLVIPFVVIKYRPIIHNQQNRLKEGPFIVASNHISMLDPLLISYALYYPIAYMAKRELFNTPWKAEFYRNMGTFALDRDNPDGATLKTALNVLRSPAKWALGIFPEGTRSKTHELLPFKKGLGSLAHKTQTPVLPVGIYRDINGRMHVCIGEAIRDVSNADAVQQKAYEAIFELTDPGRRYLS